MLCFFGLLLDRVEVVNSPAGPVLARLPPFVSLLLAVSPPTVYEVFILFFYPILVEVES